ncbi:MAG: hypothetical protein ACK56I_18395, partial [bacterium]
LYMNDWKLCAEGERDLTFGGCKRMGVGGGRQSTSLWLYPPSPPPLHPPFPHPPPPCLPSARSGSQ